MVRTGMVRMGEEKEGYGVRDMGEEASNRRCGEEKQDGESEGNGGDKNGEVGKEWVRAEDEICRRVMSIVKI